MRHLHTNGRRIEFKVLHSSRSAQAALMTLRPGESSSDAVENEHPASEQWVYVVSGRGTATVGRRKIRIKAGDVLLIEKREKHRITATGSEALVTVNHYIPPAYDQKGNVL